MCVLLQLKPNIHGMSIKKSFAIVKHGGGSVVVWGCKKALGHRLFPGIFFGFGFLQREKINEKSMSLGLKYFLMQGQVDPDTSLKTVFESAFCIFSPITHILNYIYSRDFSSLIADAERSSVGRETCLWSRIWQPNTLLPKI